MKFKICSLFLTTILAVSLFAGCGTPTKQETAQTADTKVEEKKEETKEETKEEVKEETTEKFKSRPISFLSIWSEDQDNAKILLELSDKYSQTVDNFSLNLEFISSKDLNSKVSVLLSSDSLPDVFAYESGKALIPLIESGKVVDIEKTFTEMGIIDSLDAGAVSLLKNLVDGKGLYDLPLGLNVEGYWYNKALFEKAGIANPPTTWEEFSEACEKLSAAGIQPLTVGGKDKWPLTRVLNSYIFRSIGLKAVPEAMAGERSFTDADFVAAATAIADMGAKGYFGEGVTTVDSGTSTSMLMNGQAAMHYNGSWVVQTLNDKAVNVAGDEGIGFFNVPLYTGVDTSLDDYSMNCGNILALSQKNYDEAMADWVKFVFPQLGDYAMETYGAFKGYKITSMPSETSYYTQIVADALSSAKGSTLWFEAKMDSQTSKLAQDNISLLLNGEMTPEKYMEELQKSAEQNR